MHSYIHCATIFDISFNDNQLNRIESISNLRVDIAPRSQHFFQKRSQSANAELSPRTLKHDDSFRLSLNAYNQTFYLHLEPNFDLFHPRAVILTEGESAQRIQQEKILVYKGHVVRPFEMDNRWMQEKAGVLEFDSKTDAATTQLGWARILVRHDLMSRHKTDQPIIEGAFKVQNDIYHIKATTNYNLVKRSVDIAASDSDVMVIYRDSDTQQHQGYETSEAHACGFDNMLHRPIAKRGEISRDAFTKLTGQGCPTTRKSNYYTSPQIQTSICTDELNSAADCTYVQYYKSVDNARAQIINNFNMASAVFEETFNISLGLINITIMDRTCPQQIDPEVAWNRACDANYSLGNRLSDFSLWRSKMKNDGAGLWHLMTNCATGVEVGLAWLKQLCNTEAHAQVNSDGKKQYVSGAGVSAIRAIHDCVAENCPCTGSDCKCCRLSSDQCDSSGFFMSALSNTSAKSFSPCSINTICDAFPSIGSCLADPNDNLHHVYQLKVCGNGIKEEGEECDTGGVDTDCCDAKTCTLKKSAVCEDTNEGCCHQCQIKPKNDLCRPASNPCDIAEYCSGTSAECPVDTYMRDGTSCGLGGLKCASGQCTSRDEQCLSRGFVLNITQSCVKNNEECRLLCNSPDSDKCLIFSGNFIDGTPCGFGGRCFAGECHNGGAIGSSMLYLSDHKNVAIPVGIIVFLVLCALGFVLFWFGCWRCTGYREKRNRRRSRKSTSTGSTSPSYYSDSNSSSQQLPGYNEPSQELTPAPKFGGKEKHSLDFMTPPPYISINAAGGQQQQPSEKRHSTGFTTPSSSSSSSSSSLATIVNTEDKMKTEKNE
ncbi:hypothetical protein MBANPS3_001336 [Mucor bainieri]